MITIKNIDFVASEVVDMLRNAMTGWKPVYTAYVRKIDMGGNRFFQYADLEEAMLNYISNEPKDNQTALAKYRGKPLVKSSAMMLLPMEKDSVPQRDRAAIAHLMATGTTGNGITNMTSHVSDPETALPRNTGKVGVKEFYVNGPDGRRATRRTEGTRVTYYYSATHSFNTYEYQRLY